MRVHLIGGGIAALSAASYLFRDAGVLGHNIHIYEASDRLGGALDAGGTAATGYVMRGGRMFEVKEACIHDLLSFIPSRNDPSKSIEEDLLEFNAKHGWNNKARLLGPNGKVLPSEGFGLSYRNMLDLAELVLSPESILDGKSVEDVLDLSVLDTNFWNMFGSIFALLPWHSAIETRRYLRRFFHLLPTMSSMTTIQRTRFNQYEAIASLLFAARITMFEQIFLGAVCLNLISNLGVQGGHAPLPEFCLSRSKDLHGTSQPTVERQPASPHQPRWAQSAPANQSSQCQAAAIVWRSVWSGRQGLPDQHQSANRAAKRLR